MKLLFTIITLSLCALNLQAQVLRQQGTSVGQIVQQGWEHTEAEGDLNKDGVKDLVLLAKPNFSENMKTRDDGYVYNFNREILAIYFGQEEGGFKLWKQYKELFPASDEWSSVDVSIDITDRGTLKIDTQIFAVAGSYGTDNSSYIYRYQDGDFYLIGKERSSMMRNTGEMETVSENYLTWKRQIIKDNAFEDGHKRESWSKMKKKPLAKLMDTHLK